ncbi:MAG: thiamine diphosphokinase [Bacteroidia bacterium]
MSSHHIIRDGQEPALIIANGESCSRNLLDQLLEWSPIVMVLDGAIDRVIPLGIKIDILAGDFDRNKDPKEILNTQHQVEIIHTPDQDKTDLEKGIEILLSRGHQAINIIWATGRRADHTINNMTLLARYKDKANLVIYDDYSKIFLLRNQFTKWYTAGTPISLVPIGEVKGIQTTGLLYNLNNENLNLGYRTSCSNEAATDTHVTISYESGDLLMMECWD